MNSNYVIKIGLVTSQNILVKLIYTNSVLTARIKIEIKKTVMLTLELKIDIVKVEVRSTLS